MVGGRRGRSALGQLVTGRFRVRGWLLLGGLLLVTSLLRAGEDAPSLEKPLALLGESSPLDAPQILPVTILTGELGDPDSPGNFLLSLPLPTAVAQSIPTLLPDNFAVYVLPADFPVDSELPARFRASGIMVWAHGERVFLDVRRPPTQRVAGEYQVRVNFVSGQAVLASGVAQTKVRYHPGKVDVVLVIDSSKSMRRSDPRRQRLTAARSFIEMAARDGRVAKVGIVSFNSFAEILQPLTPIAKTRPLLAALKKIKISGQTNMDRALREAEAVLAESSAGRQAVIFLTDGRNEGHRYAGEHKRLAAKKIPIYAIGLSARADHKLLDEMARDTGGKSYSAATGDDLVAIYQQVAAEIGRRVVLLSRPLRGGREKVLVPLDPSLRAASFLLNLAGGKGAFTIVDPRGRQASEHGEKQVRASYYTGRGHKFARVLRPTSGVWELHTDTPEDGLARTLTVTGETNFYLELFPPQLDKRRLTLAVTLARAGKPFPGARIRLLSHGANELPPLELFDDGAHHDSAANDGVYCGSVLLPSRLAGKVPLRLRAWGETPEGNPFVRQIGGGLREVQPVKPKAVARLVERLISEPLSLGTRLPGDTCRGTSRLTLIADKNFPLRLTPGDLRSADGETIRAADLHLSIAAETILKPGQTPLTARLRLAKAVVPGLYRGVINLQAGRAKGSVPVEVRVAEVHLTLGAKELDFGRLEPGETTTKKIIVTLHAPRPLPLLITARLNGREKPLFRNKSAVPMQPTRKQKMTLRLTVPEGTLPGRQEGRIELRVGSAVAILPLRFVVPQPPAPEPELEPLVVELTPPPPPAPLVESPPTPEPAQPQTPQPAPELEPAAKTLVVVPTPTPTTSEPTVDTPLTASAVEVGDGMRAYLFWGLVLLLLLLGLLIILVRVFVKHRMARFALASGLAHVIVIALLAYFFVLDQSVEEITKQPQLVAKLVRIKQQMGMRLSAAEKKLLSSVSKIAVHERKKLATKKPLPTPLLRERIVAKETKTKPAAFSRMSQPVKLPAVRPPSLLRERLRRRLPLQIPAPEEMTSPVAVKPEREKTVRRAVRVEPLRQLRVSAPAPHADKLARQPREVSRNSNSWQRKQNSVRKVHLKRITSRPVATRTLLRRPAAVEEVADLPDAKKIIPSRKPPRPRFRTVMARPVRVERKLTSKGNPLAKTFRPASIKPLAKTISKTAEQVTFAQKKVQVPQPKKVHEVIRRRRVSLPTANSLPENKPVVVKRMGAIRQKPLLPKRPVRNRAAFGGDTDIFAMVAPRPLASTLKRATSRRRRERVDEKLKLPTAAPIKMPRQLITTTPPRETLPRRRSPVAAAATAKEEPAAPQVVGKAHPSRFVSPASANLIGEPRHARNLRSKGAALPAEKQLVRKKVSPRGKQFLAKLPDHAALSELRVSTPVQTTIPVRARTKVRGVDVLSTSTDPGALGIVLGEVKFGSDWDSSPRALANLADAYRKRITAGTTGMKVEKRTVRLVPKELADCQLLFMTGNLPFALSSREASALRQYLAAGGMLWINDSSREGDDSFDRAVRRELRKISRSPLHKLSRQHEIMYSAYDFRQGYLRYPIPPGDKYRVDYLEGIERRGRLTILYTRNDYADGMALNPQLYVLRKSTTDLSPEEMLEGSLRFGINVVHYAIGGQASDVAENLSREEAKPPMNVFTGNPQSLRIWQDFSELAPTSSGWRAESWGNPVTVKLVTDAKDNRLLQVDIRKGKNDKSAIKFDIPASAGRRLNLSRVKSIVMDVYNAYHGGIRMALVLTTVGKKVGWRDFESKSVYLRPGWNRRVQFPLRGAEFKSRETGWKAYDSAVKNSDRCGKIGLFFYNGDRINTKLLLDNLSFSH